MPEEAGGFGSPGTVVTGSCKPSDMGVLGMKPGSPPRTVCVLNHQAISQAPPPKS